jgi:hypothetical protein
MESRITDLFLSLTPERVLDAVSAGRGRLHTVKIMINSKAVKCSQI